MPRGSNQKFKFTYLTKIMTEKTDDEHSLNMPQILDELKKYEVSAERKSIYEDFKDMERFGIDIIKEQKGRETFYHIAGREFELAEVKLLIDAVQSAKFITQKKSKLLISKVKKFVSEHQAKQLQRQIVINDRVKTMNESVYYNVDDIHTAINQNRKIKFKYYKWDINKKLVERHGGIYFVVSPWALLWDDENYYMIAFDDWDNKIKHYRVDKMMYIEVGKDERAGKEEFKNFDMAKYSKATFGMYHGDKTKVCIKFTNHMCGVFIDRFGKDTIFRKTDENHSELVVDINVSPQFFGWIFSLGNDVEIVSPKEVVNELREYTKKFMLKYELIRGEL
ncbi:helix-turn-helix transcriptional regulator [Lachnoanaerobaculum gingivalis]|uniref:helix-turn-helix transcriptional regulator n=1 Tax=Lachnoanaerobaculum gingivalis TaxID=2490855 RepID=UPI0024A6A12A|nr:WYL domain-containing protein [Lachnoanaerobaculum gingivalis]WHE88034.1 WYL domain-containing protein [Lachnoanaerobaculum gingivalis]